MSTSLAPKLEIPSTFTQQVDVSDAPLSQATITSDLVPNSITIPAEGQVFTRGHEYYFGNHVREAVAIFKDWLGK